MGRIFQAVCEYGPEQDGWTGNPYSENEDPLHANANAQNEANQHIANTFPHHTTKVHILDDGN